MLRFPRGYPVSTAGLRPIQRCIELRQRALDATRRRTPRLFEQQIDNLIGRLAKRRSQFSVCGGWTGAGDGDICVFQTGGGYHRDCCARRYDIKNYHVVAIHRDCES